MSILTIAWSTAAGMCLLISMFHAGIWSHRRASNLRQLLFAFSALAAALNAVIELNALHARTIDTYMLWYIMQVYVIGVMLVSLVWFIYLDFGTARRWLAIVITSLWASHLVLNVMSSFGVVFSSVFELHIESLPWGESYAVAVGEVNPLKYVADVASVLILLYLGDASLRLWRTGSRRRVMVIGGSSVAFMLIAGIHTPLVDAGIIRTPTFITFCFLAIVLAITSELVRDIVRSADMSKEIAANEGRWRALLEGVALIVVGLNWEGRITYVNPHFERITGFTAAEVIGSSWFEQFIPAENRNRIRERFAALRDRNEILPHGKSEIVIRDGSRRMAAWSNVRLVDTEGKMSGTLSIGEDITERERAFREIQELQERLSLENLQLRDEVISDMVHRDIVGSSDTLRYALGRVEQVAQTDTTVLLEGETGVGKELFALEIHALSRRKSSPLIKVNCAAIPSGLLETELFGHEKGAFTGAEKMRKGKFELANKGTLFLDEVGELPLELQPKLLRVLEEGEVERLGGSETIMVDVRVIASTNRILEEEVQARRFREDLYYRLQAFPISVPPLRSRRDDIPQLVTMFVQAFARKMGKKIETIPQDTLRRLSEYDWPGNIRELRNVIERAVVGTNGPVLRVLDALAYNHSRDNHDSVNRIRTLADAERSHILAILKETGWRIEGKEGAAEILDLHPNTLRNRIRKLGITRPAS